MQERKGERVISNKKLNMGRGRREEEEGWKEL
jgi:hypothetical protein